MSLREGKKEGEIVRERERERESTDKERKLEMSISPGKEE